MSAHILVVDDNPTNLELMVYLLRKFGFEVTGFTSALAGLERAKTEAFDLVLCDVLMPEIDGYEFARRYKADPELRGRPLIAVTALAMVGDREKVLAAGFDGYLPKPIEPETSVARVESFLSIEMQSSGPATSSAMMFEPPADHGTGPMILVVDDVQVNLEVVFGALRPFGYNVVGVHNLREALASARKFKPALVLSDIHMPDGDGLELITIFKADPELRDVPVVFLSSTAWNTPDRERGLELGAHSFLFRPIDPRVLLTEVENAISPAHNAKNISR